MGAGRFQAGLLEGVSADTFGTKGCETRRPMPIRIKFLPPETVPKATLRDKVIGGPSGNIFTCIVAPSSPDHIHQQQILTDIRM